MTSSPHGRVSFFLLIVLGGWLTLPLAPAVAAKEKPNPAKEDLSDIFFTNGVVPFLKIQIAKPEWAALRARNRDYVRATVHEGTNIYRDVGIHLKGAAGSFQSLEERPALTLNFDKFNDDQKFHGIDKLHLNNSVQDPSYLCEELCGSLFLQAGVPAARATHARVELNGNDLGLYVLKEGFDKTFLRRHFTKAKGNLYDGGFLHDITDHLERTSGEGPNDRGDLKALAAAAAEPDKTLRWERLNAVLDVDRFVSFIVLEMFTWHWDGYALKRNNYRVYHDPTSDKMVFFPHGMDQMFWAPGAPIQPRFDGLVARGVISTPEGLELYRRRSGELFTNVFQIDQINRQIDRIRARIRPILAGLDPGQAREHDGAVSHLRQQIEHRATSIARQLSLPPAAAIKFDSMGVASLLGSSWYSQDSKGGAVLSEAKTDDGRSTLLIIAPTGQPAVGSWRTSVELPSGRYRFEALVRTQDVTPIPDGGHVGAGVRKSGERQSRRNFAVGTSAWQVVFYDFTVPQDERETVLICEMRASRGECWFDRSSLKISRR